MDDKVKVGLMGVGNIAPQYIEGCRHFEILDPAACADIDMERAHSFAHEWGLQAMTAAEMLADPAIEIILNLTVPGVHAEVSTAIIEAGKHVYSEKPLATTRKEGQQIVDAARKAGVRVGCAPDTFLGGGIQTCRKLIDEGAIGKPVAATAFLAGHGHESWHPNPGFYYRVGGGPLFDMGPYYLTALINLLGPVRRLSATTAMSFEERIAASGDVLPVEVNTHVTGTLDFATDALGTLIMSFDVWAHNLPRIEIYGSEGSLSVPDPNTFQGPVHIWTTETGTWHDVPLTHSDAVGRGIGVADMAHALKSRRPHRASGDLAFHVLDIMAAFDESSERGEHITLTSTCDQPAPLPLDLPEGQLDQ